MRLMTWRALSISPYHEFVPELLGRGGSGRVVLREPVFVRHLLQLAGLELCRGGGWGGSM